ncbi:MAG: leucine-rich repeat protein [Paramuribaculum sp.]|nr:leucine-rich repeat protein [Paramuribaculum sp.]
MKKYIALILVCLIYSNVLALDGFVEIKTDIEVNNLIFSVGTYNGERAAICEGLKDKKEITDLIIPDEIVYEGDKYSVVEIRQRAFDGCSGLTSITIPNSVTQIGGSAFDGCSGLTSITIPNSVTQIGGSAFYGCSGLTSVTIPNSVIEIIGLTFGRCSGLISVTIPNSVTSIDDHAFYGCSGLKELTLKDGTETLSIESSTFSNCPLETLYLGRNLSDYSQLCRDLKTLKSVAIGNSVSSISSYCFSGCSGLTSITIPNSVTQIGDYAFHDCDGLTSITIPNSVTSIGDDAFSGCSGLKELTLKDGTETLSISWQFSNCPLETLYLGRNLSYNLGLCRDLKTLKSVTIGNSVSSIGNSAFAGCSGLASITIPNSVTSIGDDAFSGCSGLTSITIPNSVTSISQSAFSGCSGLTSITIPYSVTSIGRAAFSGCSGLTSIIIPNSVTSIDRGAFDGCFGIKELTLEDGTEPLSLGLTHNSFDGLFSDCPLETLYLGRNLSIFSGVLPSPFKNNNNNSALKSITIGNSVTSIGNSTFKECSGLTDITIPNSVTSIGESAFYGCSGLTSLTIPNSVTEIGWGAFYNCSGLTSITIPNSVTEIGNCAFSGCSGLTAIIIPGSVTKIGYQAFSGCFGLTSVTSLNPVPPTLVSDSFEQIVYKNVSLRVPDNSAEYYRKSDGWRNFFYILGINEICPIDIEMELADVELTEGESTILKAIITPENATEKSVTWSSSDSSVASVDATGLVTAVKAGTATITATTSNGLTASCNVTVKAKSAGIEGDNSQSANAITLSISEWSGNEGESFSITATISPNDADDKSVTWSSSDSSVASVDATGKVTAIKHGTAIITATTANGLKATCIVTVAGGSVDNPVEPEQPGDGDDDDETSAIDSIGSDANRAVRVEGNCIIAPEGSELFDLSGRRVAASGLRPGIYIVRIPGGKAVKIRL